MQLLYIYSYRRQVYQGSDIFRKRPFLAEACKRCFFCKTVCFCDTCKQCTSCRCFVNLGLYGSKSQGGIHFADRLYSPVSVKTSTHQVSINSEQIRKPGQTGLFTGGDLIVSSTTGRGTGLQSVLPRVLQFPLFGSKSKQQVASHFRSQCLESFSAGENFKMETPEAIWLSLQQGEWSRCSFSATPTSKS